MANILDKYGIKEVADVTFYEIDEDTHKPSNPVLFLDTLKVSTIEQTAENTSARGGKGNPELIIWDYNKEITLTLEDALFSAKSMAVMFGHKNANGKAIPEEKTAGAVKKTVKFEGTETVAPTQFMHEGQSYKIPETSMWYDAEGNTVSASGAWATGAIFCTFDWEVKDFTEIVISSNKFPGTYYITGDTYARNEATGKDELFQFIVPKAKILSEVTLTLEAEGDPTTFSMNVKVLRPEDKQMLKLVKYNLPSA